MKPAWKALHIIFIIVFLVGKADCQTLTRLGNYSGTVGILSTYIGFASGESAYGTNNTLLGSYSGSFNEGNSNTFIGSYAGNDTYYGSNNVYLGYNSGSTNVGSNNTFVGYHAGENWNYSPGSNNVFIGNYAGANEEGSHKLYIANTSTSTPLIYGEFDNKKLSVNGKLGVGTMSPTAKLHIQNTGTPWAQYNTLEAYGNTDVGYSVLRLHSTHAAVNDRYLMTATQMSNTHFSILMDGKVGIGTANPLQKLDVRGNIISNTSNPYLQFKHNGDNIGMIGSDGNVYGGSATNMGIYVYGNNSLELSTNNTKRLIINGDGKIGIGTVSPVAQLHINNGANTDAAVLATSTEDNKLIVSSGATDSVYVSTFRITQEFGSNRNNGYISFHRGGDTGGGFLSFGSSGIERLRIEGNGNIGIGTTTPKSNLQIGQGEQDQNTIFRGLILDGGWSSTEGTRSQNLITFKATNFVNNDPFDDTSGESLKNFHIGIVTNSHYYNHGTSRFSIIKGGQERFSVSADGKVGIGTVSPAYSLDVCGTIRAKEVKIDLDGTCSVPDYVFKEGYQLMGLKELEQFVQTNHHLPEIPSEKEMLENGVNITELQMKLLQKIEELTLYTIQQEEKIRVLEERMGKLTNAL